MAAFIVQNALPNVEIHILPIVNNKLTYFTFACGLFKRTFLCYDDSYGSGFDRHQMRCAMQPQNIIKR